MTVSDPRARRAARAIARAGVAFSAAMLLATVWASAGSDVRQARAAAVGGIASVVTPEGLQLDAGDGETEFTLDVPIGAACSGDSANDAYFVYSYMVAATVDPGTLAFDFLGPVPAAYGEPQSDFRQPLYDVFGTGYSGAATAAADEPGGPGLVINIPTFSLMVFDGVFVPSGDYNVGIACYGPAGGDESVDSYWNVAMTVVATAGPPPTIAWSVTQSTVTTTALAVDPVGQADVGAAVTLTASVAPAEAAGTVAFSRGVEAIGTPVEVVAGVATLVTSDLAAGSFDLSAAFTPTDLVLFASSFSEAVSYVIGSTADPTVTTTALTVDPVGQADVTEAVTLTASVAPAEAAGTVAFSRGVEAIGTPVEVVAGVATLVTSDLAAGSFDLSAAFTPTDPLLYASSLSGAVSYVIEPTTASTTTTTSTSTSSTTTTTSTTSTSTTTTSTPTSTTTGSTTTTTPVATPSTIAPGGPAGIPVGSGGLGTLPRTGPSLSMIGWAALLVVFGRISVLLGRPAAVRPGP